MRYADAGGVRVAYDDEGPRAGDAVVFLPGWCNSGRSFSPCSPNDWLPGIGSSGWTGAGTGIPAIRHTSLA
jgi:pimeloyl-ACP methyl ester carboxylesterase